MSLNQVLNQVPSSSTTHRPQVIQLFDSWAHHLSPDQFAEFSLPYADRVARALKAKYPHVPVIFHANGGEQPYVLRARV